jgi:ABC-2 type transport system ATP-binding protein
MDTQSPVSGSRPAVRLDGITKRFGNFTAVDHVSLEIHSGEIFGFIGPNGAGKSTLMKMLTTLLPPTSGSAEVAGFDLISQPHLVRRSIGYVPQLVSADGSLTGFENLLLSARLYGIPRHEQRRRIATALARMDLTGSADVLVEHYSGGMIRRLEIAQSMLHRPAVLFMDEPTIGLDPAAREAVWRHVLELRQSVHVTLILTSHYMEEVEELCDRIALMTQGRTVAVGTPVELKAQVGPDASLDDVFARLVREYGETEAEKSYVDVKRARRAARS